MVILRQMAVTVAFAMLLAGTAIPSAADDKAPSPRSASRPVKVLEEFDIPRDGSDVITVPITLEKETYRFLVNMTYGFSMYDLSLRDQLGEPLGTHRVKMAGGESAEVEFFRPPDAKLGRVSVKTDFPVVCHDLRRLRLVQRIPVHGILGMDFLQEHVVRLDFDRGKLAILSAAPADSGEAVPIYDMRYGTPTIKVQLPGRGFTRCTLGCDVPGTILLDPDTFEKLASEGHVWSVELDHPHVLESYYEKFGRLDRLTLGETTHRDVTFYAGNSELKSPVLGLKFLARYRITADFPNKVLYLKEGANFRKRDYSAPSGMSWAINHKTNELYVHEVADGSAAEKAGFLPDDVIRRINGAEANSYSIYRLMDLLTNPGKVVMTVQRGDEEVSLSMVLHKLLPDDQEGSDKAPPPRSAPGPVKVLEEFDIPRHGSDVITLPITFEKGTYRFLVSMGMGSNVSAYDLSLRDQLGEPLGKKRVKGVGDTSATVEFFRAPDAKLGQVSVKTDSPVVCFDLKSLRLRQRIPVHGILGMDFLREHVVRFDFDRGKLAILSAAPAVSNLNCNRQAGFSRRKLLRESGSRGRRGAGC